MYANKVNGFTVTPGESVTSQFEYISIATTVNIIPNGVTVAATTGTPTSQAALDKLIEIISLRGQPVILGAPTTSDNTNFTLRVATEHLGGWNGSTPALSGSGSAIALHGIDQGFTNSNTTATFATAL